MNNRTIIAAAGLLACGTIVGCGPTDGERFRDLVKQINRLKGEKIEVQERLAQRDATIVALEGQLGRLRQGGLAQPVPVFAIDHVEILDITSGSDLDDVLGDDHVTVYFRPVDRDGDPLKRAGEIKIRLLDNLAASGSELLGMRVDNNPERIQQLWYGRFWTDFFKIEVPFRSPSDLQPGQEVDVHLSFEEFATGKLFTDRTAVKINAIRPDNR